MDLVTQDSYDKRHEKSTIPPALAKEKEIKDEPIQKNNHETNKTTGRTPRRQRNITTVDSADNKIGPHDTNAPQRPWNATTATK